MVAQEVANVSNELEQLKRRFEEFRSLRPSRDRLPQALWKEAAGRRYP
jgi:phage-related minor tail protein